MFCFQLDVKTTPSPTGLQPMCVSSTRATSPVRHMDYENDNFRTLFKLSEMTATRLRGRRRSYMGYFMENA